MRINPQGVERGGLVPVQGRQQRGGDNGVTDVPAMRAHGAGSSQGLHQGH